jgi:hypothetical protein
MYGTHDTWRLVSDRCPSCANIGRGCIGFYNPLEDTYVSWCVNLQPSLLDPARHYRMTVFVVVDGRHTPVELPAPYTFSTDRSLDYVLYRGRARPRRITSHSLSISLKTRIRGESKRRGVHAHMKLIERAEQLRENSATKAEYNWWVRFIRHVRRDPRMVGVKTASQARGCVSLARDTRRLWKREPMRLTRYMSSIGLDSVACKHMSARYLAKYEPDANMDLIAGEDMKLGLMHDIGTSVCMSGEKASAYAALYYENPDKIQMLVKNLRYEYVDDEQDILAPQGDCFAFVWTDDDGQRWLDNTYPRDETHDADYVEWARKHNVVVLWNRQPDDPSQHDAIITLRYPSTGYFPYIDHFSNADVYPDDKVVLHESGEYSLQHTDGSYDESLYCYGCDDRIDPAAYYEVGYDVYCEDCYETTFTTCAYCEEIVARDDVISVDDCEYWCDDCVKHHAFECHYCDDVHSGTCKSVSLANGDTVDACKECAESRTATCENCGERVELERMYDGDTCNDCAPNEEDEHE